MTMTEDFPGLGPNAEPTSALPRDDVGGRLTFDRSKAGRKGVILAALDVPHDVRVYPDSGHRFMSEASGAGAVITRIARMSYQPEDAADAWQRINAFFSTYLS